MAVCSRQADFAPICHAAPSGDALTRLAPEKAIRQPHRAGCQVSGPGLTGPLEPKIELLAGAHQQTISVRNTTSPRSRACQTMVGAGSLLSNRLETQPKIGARPPIRTCELPAST